MRCVREHSFCQEACVRPVGSHKGDEARHVPAGAGAYRRRRAQGPWCRDEASTCRRGQGRRRCRAGHACVRGMHACVQGMHACMRAGHACMRAGHACKKGNGMEAGVGGPQ
jgi:hypothetical protein